MSKRLSVAAVALAMAVVPAFAVTKVATWTWPTVRTDGSALPLTQIGGVQLCDTSAPLPGSTCAGGTVVPCPATIPPTTPTGTCTANLIAGHTFALVIADTASPPDFSAGSNTQTVPLTAPAAVADFKLQ